MNKHIGPEAAADFAEKLPLSKSADIEKRFAWAVAAGGYLEERYDEKTICTLRQDCNCFRGRGAADKLAKYLKKAGTVKGMMELHNAAETYGTLEYISENSFLLIYPECYCSCVERVPGLVPRAWCECSVGYVVSACRMVWGDGVRGELLESVKMGGTRCAIRVEW